MVSPSRFYDLLIENGVSFFVGVPDSLLKDFCAYITDHVGEENQVIAANEGNALAIATGYHLSTNKIALVYMQNSGLGNAVNPLLSLTDEDVYKIPVILLIGWRGKPGESDEPQHVKQGKLTLQLLEALGIRYSVLRADDNLADKVIQDASKYISEVGLPYAIVVEKGVFDKYESKAEKSLVYSLGREEALKVILDSMNLIDVVVSTTGKISREIFEYREVLKQSHSRDFLTVGSMGHSLSIALGLSMKCKNRVYCVDGDGALIMHMGSLSIVGQKGPTNLIHIVLDNESHDSVGGQPTASANMDIAKIARACGYKNVYTIFDKKELKSKLKLIGDLSGPSFIVVKVNKGARSDLGRPTTTPQENKKAFMSFIK